MGAHSRFPAARIIRIFPIAHSDIARTIPGFLPIGSTPRASRRMLGLRLAIAPF